MTTGEVVIPITERALSARVDRALSKRGERLRMARSRGVEASLGRRFTVRGDRVTRTNVDLAELAYELGVLRGGEKLRASD